MCGKKFVKVFFHQKKKITVRRFKEKASGHKLKAESLQKTPKNKEKSKMWGKQSMQGKEMQRERRDGFIYVLNDQQP